MKRKSEDEAVESGDVPPETKPDALADYRDALADLAAASEKVQTLRQIEAEVLAQAAKLETDREAALNLAAEVGLEKALEGDVDAQMDIAGLTETSTKLEICRRKLSDLSGRAQAAEGEQAAGTNAVMTGFGGLYRALHAHEFERRKTKNREELIAGVGELPLEQFTALSKEMAAVKTYEITASGPEGLLAQAGRLLERVSATEGFAIPPLVAATPTAPPEPPVGLPWLGRGMSAEEIDAEVLAIRTEDRSLDIAGTYRRLKELHPELFPTQAEVLKMMQPIEQPKAGVYETRVPHLGDTFSSEEEFQRKIAARKEQFSHA